MRVHPVHGLLAYATFGIQVFLLVAGIGMAIGSTVKSSLGCGMIATAISMLIVTVAINQIQEA
jgi:hypothetical protein